jgi:hypothetical protein
MIPLISPKKSFGSDADHAGFGRFLTLVNLIGETRHNTQRRVKSKLLPGVGFPFLRSLAKLPTRLVDDVIACR